MQVFNLILLYLLGCPQCTTFGNKCFKAPVASWTLTSGYYIITSLYIENKYCSSNRGQKRENEGIGFLEL